VTSNRLALENGNGSLLVGGFLPSREWKAGNWSSHAPDGHEEGCQCQNWDRDANGTRSRVDKHNQKSTRNHDSFHSLWTVHFTLEALGAKPSIGTHGTMGPDTRLLHGLLRVSATRILRHVQRVHYRIPGSFSVLYSQAYLTRAFVGSLAVRAGSLS
jgi:hypothetical protein